MIKCFLTCACLNVCVLYSIYLLVCDFQEILFSFGEIICRPAVVSILMKLTFIWAVLPQNFQGYPKSWPGFNSLESSSFQNEERLFRVFLVEIHFPGQTVNLRPWRVSYILKATNVMVHLRYLHHMKRQPNASICQQISDAVKNSMANWTYISTTSEIISCWGEVPCLSLIVGMQLFPTAAVTKLQLIPAQFTEAYFPPIFTTPCLFTNFTSLQSFQFPRSQNCIFLQSAFPLFRNMQSFNTRSAEIF